MVYHCCVVISVVHLCSTSPTVVFVCALRILLYNVTHVRDFHYYHHSSSLFNLCWKHNSINNTTSDFKFRVCLLFVPPPPPPPPPAITFLLHARVCVWGWVGGRRNIFGLNIMFEVCPHPCQWNMALWKWLLLLLLLISRKWRLHSDLRPNRGHLQWGSAVWLHSTLLCIALQISHSGEC